ncbi:hypothetical protein JQK87_00165 [Streptomyces sp. G44]|uniref:EXPERA domain-containing protein n=1 Tax=Streptomyces sp. G44 TaxID=2807632 RepID=UPI00195FF9D6|nr:emopamil-binding family protein [Streptomyces sp. G44]MBM7166866.1 hypothetical protein [Streptomyces sp. G44]
MKAPVKPINPPTVRPARLRGKDSATLGFLAFSCLLAFSVELYFVLHFRTIHHQDDVFATLFSIYGDGDRTYYGQGDVYLPFALETLNVYVTQVLNLLLGWAILRDRPWRYPLQLTVASYLSYSVILYFWHAHAAGYPDMPVHDAWGYFIFYAPNLPWLLGNLWMGCAAFRVITTHLGSTHPRDEDSGDPAAPAVRQVS